MLATRDKLDEQIPVFLHSRRRQFDFLAPGSDLSLVSPSGIQNPSPSGDGKVFRRRLGDGD
jgi:hypothetical protein